MEVIYEIKIIGHLARVAAVDPVTGTEAIISGPAKAGPELLKRTAAKKLQFLLDKQKD